MHVPTLAIKFVFLESRLICFDFVIFVEILSRKIPINIRGFSPFLLRGLLKIITNNFIDAIIMPSNRSYN